VPPGGFPLAIILTHGSTGDLTRGELPLYAAAAAGVRVPCLRFTCGSPDIPVRARVMQVRGMAPAARRRLASPAGGWVSVGTPARPQTWQTAVPASPLRHNAASAPTPRHPHPCPDPQPSRRS
jgi:hypothetical protein